jgi:DNA repair protein RadC
MKAKEKLMQYGLPALTDNELLEVLKYKKPIDDFYQSPEYRAAKELVRRKEIPTKQKINSSKASAEIFSFLEDNTEEQFWAMFLKRNGTLISYEMITAGAATSCLVDVQKIIRRAIDHKAQNLILCHNHPSGELRPSSADDNMTIKVKNAAALFDMQVIDSLIIGKGGNYFSYAEEGKM